jgi:hypothetical protein
VFFVIIIEIEAERGEIDRREERDQYTTPIAQLSLPTGSRLLIK